MARLCSRFHLSRFTGLDGFFAHPLVIQSSKCHAYYPNHQTLIPFLRTDYLNRSNDERWYKTLGNSGTTRSSGLPGTGRHAGLLPEPARDIVRIGEPQIECRLPDPSTPREFPLASLEKLPVPPLPKSESRGTTHESVEIILLESDLSGEFSGCGNFFFHLKGTEQPSGDGRTIVVHRNLGEAGMAA